MPVIRRAPCRVLRPCSSTDFWGSDKEMGVASVSDGTHSGKQITRRQSPNPGRPRSKALTTTHATSQVLKEKKNPTKRGGNSTDWGELGDALGVALLSCRKQSPHMHCYRPQRHLGSYEGMLDIARAHGDAGLFSSTRKPCTLQLPCLWAGPCDQLWPMGSRGT